jgi:CBS domain-containing protein
MGPRALIRHAASTSCEDESEEAAMKLWRVDDVMTTSVISADEQTPYREVAEVLIHNGVSAVPVVSRSGEVVGVVSEADLALKVEAAGEPLRRLRLTAEAAASNVRRGPDRCGPHDQPAVVVARWLALAAAARRMHRAGVKRMPVVDATGQLAGIVTRGDLLRVHLRPDAEIRQDVVAELRGTAAGRAPDHA